MRTRKSLYAFIILLASATVQPAFAEPKGWLGVFTTDIYPRSGCDIVAVGSYLYTGTSGWQGQPRESSEGYLSNLDESQYRTKLIEIAAQQGFNAIVGFQYDVYGGFTAYSGQFINGVMGVGAFQTAARGTPVKVVCK